MDINTEMPIGEFLNHLQNNCKKTHTILDKETYLYRLRDHFEDLQREDVILKVGDVVKAKPGFDTIIPLKDGFPAIITDIFDPIRITRYDYGVWDEGLRMNCNILLIVNDNVIECSFDTRKLELYGEEKTNPNVEAKIAIAEAA